ncbi:hypothetical protein ACL9RI_23810 [Janthinobacterium sp. Mn2066]|uniref:hypothetical protein n=1 Tax=Janthinobacterium sp. Mn2066 TaxID=3395264 RepID=UPI003BC25E92
MTTLPRRQVPAITAIMLVHGLVLWQLASQRSVPPPFAPQAVTTLRFYPTSVAAKTQATPAVLSIETRLQRPARPVPQAISPPAAIADTPPDAAPAPAAGALDLDALKRQARDAARDSKPVSLDAPQLTSNDKAAFAIARAARPKCDNDYKPQIGNVRFEGLAKIPFLLKGAAGDSGCKW